MPDIVYGQYGFPQIEGVTEIPDVNFINSEYAARIRDKEERKRTGVFFYEWDWKFDKVWNYPIRNAKWLSDYGCVVSPQFSLYYDMPVATQIWSTYKSRWLGAYWQSLGITVIPDVQWGNPDTFEWCFDALPEYSIVSIGQRMNRSIQYCTDLFYAGFDELCKRLSPTLILAYVPKSLELPSGIPIKRISERVLTNNKVCDIIREK